MARSTRAGGAPDDPPARAGPPAGQRHGAALVRLALLAVLVVAAAGATPVRRAGSAATGDEAAVAPPTTLPAATRRPVPVALAARGSTVTTTVTATSTSPEPSPPATTLPPPTLDAAAPDPVVSTASTTTIPPAPVATTSTLTAVTPEAASPARPSATALDVRAVDAWPRTGTRLGIYGDSIVDGWNAGPAVEGTLLAAGYDVHRWAHAGWRSDQVLPDARASAAQPLSEEIAVVDVGTNDAIQSVQGRWSLDWTFATLAEWEAAFPQARCLVFVLVNTESFNPRLNDAASQVNAWLVARAAVNPMVRLADWPAAVRARYLATGTYVLADGIHPTVAGQRLLAELVAATVATCPTA